MTNGGEHEPEETPPETASLARDVYLMFLAREAAGDPASFEELCQRRPAIAAELRRLRQGSAPREVEPTRQTDLRLEESTEPELLRLLQRVAASPARAARYRLGPELGRGAMGQVYRAWDEELARDLAVKVLHARSAAPSPDANLDRLLRFVREAQITSQLDHPCIVPVHEFGIDESGRPFFAMKLVNGRELKHVFDSAWTGEDGWSLTRAVGVLFRVCEAMAYAHSKGVVHRDLKPTNIMVGRFGEVFVMDWGVAHVAPPGEDGDPSDRSASVRAAKRSVYGDASLTEEGAILGTAAYMPPEQALGDSRLLGSWTDVYAVGALLYHLLARRAPYLSADSSSSTEAILERLRAGPPEPLAVQAPDTPPELVSICEKAMARQPERRYARIQELGADLQAYLEGRVVRAHRTGVRAELRKWIQRHRGFVLASSFALLIALVSSIALLRWRTDRARLALLKKLQEPSQLLEQFEFLWPVSSERLPEIREWVAAADRVLQQGETYRAQLRELRERALPWDTDAPAEKRARAYAEWRVDNALRTIAHYEGKREKLLVTGGKTFAGEDLEKVEEELAVFRGRFPELEQDRDGIPRHSWTFSTANDELMHERLARIDRELGLLAGESGALSRVEIAHRVLGAFERAGSDESSELAWTEASRSIADSSLCPMYQGLELRRQEHLVPIGRDPHSGLWEFAHVLTGSVPARASDGRLAMDESSAVVLVLVPPGLSWQGSQLLRDELPNHDPHHQRIEQPMVSMEIHAYFLSKFELTTAQWERLTSQTEHQEGDPPAESTTRPATEMTWEEASTVLRCIGLELPAEAQWEYATRAGTAGSWWTGADESSLPSAANLLDPEAVVEWTNSVEITDQRFAGTDGWIGLAPVGRLRANAFGLHDVIGNAAELCRDQGATTYGYRNIIVVTGERPRNVDHLRVARGGSYISDPRDARSASRLLLSRDQEEPTVGLRPSRAIE